MVIMVVVMVIAVEVVMLTETAENDVPDDHAQNHICELKYAIMHENQAIFTSRAGLFWSAGLPTLHLLPLTFSPKNSINKLPCDCCRNTSKEMGIQHHKGIGFKYDFGDLCVCNAAGISRGVGKKLHRC